MEEIKNNKVTKQVATSTKHTLQQSLLDIPESKRRSLDLDQIWTREKEKHAQSMKEVKTNVKNGLDDVKLEDKLRKKTETIVLKPASAISCAAAKRGLEAANAAPEKKHQRITLNFTSAHLNALKDKADKIKGADAMNGASEIKSDDNAPKEPKIVLRLTTHMFRAVKAEGKKCEVVNAVKDSEGVKVEASNANGGDNLEEERTTNPLRATKAGLKKAEKDKLGGDQWNVVDADLKGLLTIGGQAKEECTNGEYAEEELTEGDSDDEEWMLVHPEKGLFPELGDEEWEEI